MTWRKHSGALLVACAVAAGLVTAPGPAGAERTRELQDATRQFTRLLDGQVVRSWHAQTMTDPAGDNTPARDPRGDVVAGVFDTTGGTLRITVRTRQPAAPTTREWTVNGSSLAFAFDTTGDAQIDFVAVLLHDGTNLVAGVVNASDQVACSAKPVFDGTNLGLEFPLSCIGGAADGFDVQAMLTYKTDTTTSVDVAPDGSSTAPSPTSPAPTAPSPIPGDVLPQGRLDTIVRTPGSVRAVGWAVDRNTQAPTAVHIHLDGEPVAAGTAELPRPDVARALPGFGELRGFDIAVPIGTAGPHRLCAFALNERTASANTLLGCRAVLTAPHGRIDGIAPTSDGVEITGWAIDPDTAGAAAIHVYVDGVPVGLGLASAARPDVASAHPGYGEAHGFSIRVPAAEGRRRVCVYAIDSVIGSQNVALGCPTVTVNRSPFGALDFVARSPGGFRVAGWAVDPDGGSSTVHVYVDGRAIGAIAAASPRPDVAARYPGAGADHGFDQVLPGSGRTVCVYAINQGAGTNAVLGCKVV